MKRALVFLILLALVFSGTAYAFDFGDMGLGDMLGGITSMFSPEVEEAYGPRELVELKDINIELTNVMESAGSNMYPLAEDREFLIVEFEIENKGNTELTLSTMLSFSTWCDGELCNISLEALATAMLAGKPQLDCIVEPGESVTGVIGYEVPDTWKEVIVQYKGDSIIGKTTDFAIVR